MENTRILAAIIVTYNGSKWIDRCLQSIEETFISHVYVLDNGSNDDTRDRLAIYKNKSRKIVSIIESNSNLGFAKANNILIKKALQDCADKLVLINQDLYVNTDAISDTLYVQEQDLTSITTVVHINSDNSVDKGFGEYFLKYNKGKLRVFANDSRYLSVVSCDFINAAFWMITKQAVARYGLFDERFLFYYEDYEYCDRLNSIGGCVNVVLNATVVHDRGERGGKHTKTTLSRGEESYLLYVILSKKLNTINKIVKISKIVIRRLCFRSLLNALVLSKKKSASN